ncbi:odorant receptor 67a-like [Polistes fuscatus]|uniref:odorant receptor 67a-like n=1 Tax=Polistes fuscatus TaxID=30207 RepID=UPI001CA8BF68|nr:odorant receptor 67a-like [Polistes fuscatus]
MTQELGFRNNGYKSDVDYVVKVARTLLTPIGIWPLYRGDSLSDKIKMYIQISLIFGLMCCLLIPHLIYTYFDAEKLIKEMKVIAAQVFSTLAIVKFWTVIINRKEIGYCLLEMERQYKEVECEDDLMVMVKSAKIGRLFTIAYLSLSYGGALPYHIILPLVAEPVVKDDNTTMLPLPYLSDYIFFVVETSPIFEIFFVGQIFVSSIILSTNCGVYSLIASCVMHSCCLFEVVRRQIDTIFQYENEDNLRKRLYVIVDNHLQAIRYAEKIEQALNIVFLCEMVGCTIIICFLEFGVLVDWEDKETLGMMTYGVLMTSIFVNVFIISYIGDRLKEESELVGESTYSIEWYRLPNTIIRDLVMIIVRSNRPSRLTAGKIFDVSLQGFCDVCKTSAAYLNFLRTMVA